MSGESSAIDPTQNLSLTPEEKRLYGQLFRQADFDNVGVVTGEIAVTFFEKTRLDRTILGKIWQISDTENRGFLTPAGFSVALRLLGHAQAGRDPTPELARQSGPLPHFDGVAIPTPASPPPPASIQPQGTGTGPVRIPPLIPDKAAQYASIFERQPLIAGNLLPGDQAKQIFERSSLPNEILSVVWQLVDTEQRGALIVSEFIIAMHLLNAMKVGALKSLPSSLPPALIEAANRRGPAPRQSPTTTGTLSAIPRQLSGSTQMRTGSPLGRSPPPQVARSAVNVGWAITPAEKAKFDTIYDDLDKTKRGYITGEEAVPFFSQSNLNPTTLAQIWDLADINSQGVLSRDEFAVAMYLIRQQRANRDGTAVLPATLPPSLVPPSMRNQVRPTTANSAFDAPIPQPQPPTQKSALDDLFELDGPVASMQAPLPTGGSAASDPFSTGPANATPASPVRASPTASQFRPFVPSSSFGRGLTQQPQHTGDSKQGGSAADDLLGDADPEISSKLTNETTELANISNQIGTLTKQMTNLQTQRSTTQHDLTQASQQKKNFEQRLTQLRTMYEKEASDVRALEEQLNTAKADTRKLQAECMSLEGTYHDLASQKQQVVTALQADQQENASLKEKIRTLNSEIAQLKPQIEKLKSEARQQKGLVAINKKQLSTNESERDRLKSEIEDLSKGGEELPRQMTGSSLQSGPAGISSPTPSAGSGNNPFFKRTASTDMIGAFASPPMKASDKSFDDIFGSPFPQASATPPAAVHHTGNSTASGASFGTPTVSTPNVSRQTTLNVEPPPPPESRQISSSFLPLKDASESLSSSRQVSPPLSRTGDEKGGAASPVPAPNVGAFSPLEPANTGTSNISAATEAKPATTGDSANGLAISSNAPAAAAATETEEKPAEPSVRDSDPFASMDQAKAKAEFDSAFASFTKIHKTQDKAKDDGNVFTSFNTEFPPISELERDESESDSETGFDDDFAPSSPKGKDSQVTVKDTPVSPAPAVGKPESPVATTTAFGDDAVDKTPAPTNNRHFLTFRNNDSAADNFFDSPLDTTPTAVTTAPAPQASTSSTTAKTPFDSDSDDDFSGLEDAKEGSADDDFANISRSGLDEFNSVFDSSPPASQAKTESTAFGGGESSFDFGTVSTNSLAGCNNTTPTAVTTSGSAAVPATTTTAAGISASDAQDWDAMFSNLDSAGSDSPKTAEAPKDAAAARPDLSRTETGDDPLLKNLTSMGYSRADALSALEKYDYDIDRAANFLASSS
ncbi:hypothetical protein jhhlp_001270 [Lomentospora prolificans]|uniref:Uncharacterized protein n=1 Tax=Lomentospora prolificans TaxID=41688 RepID=A0A2N3NHR7_9PEZI|nr:hypothetical protein jhhlp_001270 [Lomentospora prolificans]